MGIGDALLWRALLCDLRLRLAQCRRPIHDDLDATRGHLHDLPRLGDVPVGGGTDDVLMIGHTYQLSESRLGVAKANRHVMGDVIARHGQRHRTMRLSTPASILPRDYIASDALAASIV